MSRFSYWRMPADTYLGVPVDDNRTVTGIGSQLGSQLALSPATGASNDLERPRRRWWLSTAKQAHL